MKELGKLFEKLAKDYEKERKRREKEFIKATEIGLCEGDRIIFSDGSIGFAEDIENMRVKYKNIVKVERPIMWEEVKIRKPRFGGRRKKGDKTNEN